MKKKKNKTKEEEHRSRTAQRRDDLCSFARAKNRCAMREGAKRRQSFWAVKSQASLRLATRLLSAFHAV
jgi:hypothetical protein